MDPVHTTGSLFRQFRLALGELAETEPKESNVVQTLEKVARLYGLWAVEEHAQYFLQAGFYSTAQIDRISEIVTDLCAELRQSAVPLTDAFCYTDHILNSPLGVHNGDIYEVYFVRWAAATRLSLTRAEPGQGAEPAAEGPPVL